MPKQLHPYAVIVKPLVTEKSTGLAGLNKYAFEVMPHANKLQIKQAVEVSFDVQVRSVNTCTVHGKVRRFGKRLSKGRSWKKAIVTLEPGYNIELFEGI